MNKIIELIHVYSQYEYISFALLALLFPLIMQISSFIFTDKVQMKEVFLSYLSTLSAIIYFISYITLGYFANASYSPYTPLFYILTMVILIFQLLYIMYNRYSLVFALLPIILLAPLTLSNQLSWSISAMFLITYILSNIAFFIAFKKYER